MRTNSGGMRMALAVILAALTVASARANLVAITYRISGSEPIELGSDTLALDSAGPNTIRLAPDGVSVRTARLNEVVWDYAGEPAGTSSATLTRTMTVTVGTDRGDQLTQTLSQEVQIKVTANKRAETQELTIDSGAPVDFTWTTAGFYYDLQVTALSLALSHRGYRGHFSGNVSGRIWGDFVLTKTPVLVLSPSSTTAVPEPATTLAGALLLLPFAASAARTLRKRQAA